MRVILADDASMIREGLARMLAEAGVDVVAQAGDGQSLMAEVERHHPDVAVVDIRMPPTFTTEGLVAAAQVRADYPDVAVMILSQHVDSHYASQLLASERQGVGYLLKDRVVDVEEFVVALERIRGGGTVVDRSLVDELLASPRVKHPLADLTPRELEVLSLIAEGRTDKGIAMALFVSCKTVEAHVGSILRKLDLPVDATVNRRVHAVLAFIGAIEQPGHDQVNQRAPRTSAPSP
ncbi:MAG: response regulator transcription factor [Actinomycetota bacterium]|nr:response regulator transcription factor [Actinomycetota bacterium]